MAGSKAAKASGVEKGPQLVRRPLVGAATFFCLGALVDGGDRGGATVAAFCALMLAGYLALERRILAILLLIAAFGAAGHWAALWRLPPTETASVLAGDRPVVFEGIVAEAPEDRPGGPRQLVDLVATATTPAGVLVPVTGRVLVWLGAPCGAAGDRIRAFGRLRTLDDASFPGGTSPKARAARRGVALQAFVPSDQECVVLQRRAASGLLLKMEQVRASVHGVIDRALDPVAAGVVRAFATGDRARIDSKIEADFQASGLSHLLAVSGLNLAIVAGLFVLGLGWLLARSEAILLGFGPERLAALVALPGVGLYTLLVGASPSAVRAALMVVALLISKLVHRVRESWSALALALILMVAWDPTTLADVSFQLSFAAVAALLRIHPALWRLLPEKARNGPSWRRVPLELFVATLAATLGTLPLVLRHFGRVSVVGLIANLPAAPLSSLVLVPLSLLGGLVGLWSEAVARPILWLAGQSADLLVGLAALSATIPGAAFTLPRPTIAECLLFYGALIGFTVERRPRLRRLGVACGVLLLGSLAFSEAHKYWRTEARVTFLPVGQGDAIILELPRDKVVLVDTGPAGVERDAASRVILPYLRHQRIRRLDWVILTHPHADHVGGLATLSEAMPIGEVWWTGDRREVPPALLEPLERLKTRIVKAGAQLEAGPVQLEVLSPRGPVSSYAGVNDASVVVMVRYGKRSILLTGDAESGAETELVRALGEGLLADVLKAGHHGSRTSSIEPFVALVRPKHVIYSVGKGNLFRFPHPSVVERFQKRSVQAWRTDHHGAITVTTDGEALTVEPFRR